MANSNRSRKNRSNKNRKSKILENQEILENLEKYIKEEIEL